MGCWLGAMFTALREHVVDDLQACPRKAVDMAPEPAVALFYAVL